MNAKRDCEARDGEQRTDTGLTCRDAHVITEQAPIEAQGERENRQRVG